ncbi:MAG: hypothetical protein GY946_33105 [bacterium]|nr:hypothetical protein [bacterium]
MTDHCPTLDILIDIDQLSKRNPGRAHLDDCPRCLARLADYRDFINGGAEVPAGALESAMRGLEAALAVEIDPDVKPFPTPSRPFLMRPVVRGALALAAILLAIVALNGLWQRPATEKIRLRAPDPETVGMVIELFPGQHSGTGGIELSWTAFPDADDYELVLLAPDLSLITTLNSEGRTSLSLDAARMEALFGNQRVLAWRVRALSGGDPIGESASSSLDLSRRP